MTTEPFMLQVSASPDGLTIHLPTGRKLRVSADDAGAKFLRKMLQDAEAGLRYQRGYIGQFPTQEIAVIWERQERARAALARQKRELDAESIAREKEAARKRSAKAKAEQAKRVWAKRGIDSSKIKINI